MIPQIKTSLKSFVKECAGRRSPATTEPRIWRLKNKRHFLLCSILHLKTVCSVENSLSYSVFLLCAPENLCCYNDIILTKIPIETAIRDRISISIMGNYWVWGKFENVNRIICDFACVCRGGSYLIAHRKHKKSLSHISLHPVFIWLIEFVEALLWSPEFLTLRWPNTLQRHLAAVATPQNKNPYMTHVR